VPKVSKWGVPYNQTHKKPTLLRWCRERRLQMCAVATGPGLERAAGGSMRGSFYTGGPFRPCPPLLPTLQLIDLACRRGDRVLFEGVHMSVAAGHMVWLRGSNGRGKTSLLRLVTGLASPEKGRVLWGGEPIRKSPTYRNELVHIGHANALKDDLTVAESLAFLARIHARDVSAQSLQQGLEMFGLSSRRRAPVRTLSQGQRRRVALARLALESRPGLWVLDEPFDALDIEGIERLNALMAQHQERGGSVLLTSHQAVISPALMPVEFDLDRLGR
jgi:heme exporter protein A